VNYMRHTPNLYGFDSGLEELAQFRRQDHCRRRGGAGAKGEVHARARVETCSDPRSGMVSWPQSAHHDLASRPVSDDVP
jgi:hypothetical protein